MSDTSYNPRRPAPVCDTQKLPKELRGKYVTRAAFAKMQSEKQQLERDMYRMVHLGDKSVWQKYSNKFKQQQDFNDALKELLKSNNKSSI